MKNTITETNVETEAQEYVNDMDENLEHFQIGKISRAEFSRQLEKLIANRSIEVSHRYRQIQYARAAESQ